MESYALSHLKSPLIIHGKTNEMYQVVYDAIKAQRFDKYITAKGRKENRIEYYNIPAAFDIETSSFYQDGQKRAVMYIWQFGICGLNFTGRTWVDFLETLRAVKAALDISLYKRLVIYVHNLSYEFQWFRKHIKWKQVFAIDMRKVCYAVSEDGFEFRCSYILTGKSLDQVGKDLTLLPVDKLHTLDYKLIRLSTTDIEQEEMDYCINDIRVVQHLILEKILQDGNITKIPLTKTGYVRNFLRKECLYGGEKTHKKGAGKQYIKYRRLMNVLQLDGYREYKLCKEAFMGGFTHSNPKLTRKVITQDPVLLKSRHLKNRVKKGLAGSDDYTSDYPFHMVAYKRFPMSKGEFVRPRNLNEFEHNLKYYACIFEIELHDVCATFYNDFYIPFSKCRCIKNYQTSNGRVVRAETLIMTMTELDYDIIRNTYSFDESKTRIGYFVRYRRGYLPTPLVKCILELYKDKTELKGVEGREEYYQLRKELLNSCYGAIVTDILQPEQVYDDDWRDPKVPDFEETIDKYNNKKNRFLFYPWGIFVTALARHSLWGAILEFGDDYIYSDTDSIKAYNMDKHERYIENYNRHCKVLLKEAMEYHGLPLEMCCPKTIKGEEKWLGVWDFEGYYDGGFCTLGSKRYMTLKTNKNKIQELSITVSGLNKKVTVPYLLDRYKTFDKCFSVFDDGLSIPAGHTGKLTHTYIDDGISGEVMDYKGQVGHYEELSYIHLEDQEYQLGINQIFKDFMTSLDKDIY